jgi:putative flippase GtrA
MQIAIEIRQSIEKYLLPKLKFGMSSIVATAIDYLVFFLLFPSGMLVAWIQAIAQASGMLTNFVLQRFFIFEKKRSLSKSFAWSISFSLIAIALSALLVHGLYQLAFFQEHPIVMKVGVTILFFFFNFYTKQFAFEKKISW